MFLKIISLFLQVEFLEEDVMPTYDYRCKSCEDIFEYFQKMTDTPLKVCTKCGGELNRLIGTGLSPVFKGSGFYQTDYKNNKKSTAKSDASSKPSSDKSETKSDSKKSEKKKSA